MKKVLIVFFIVIASISLVSCNKSIPEETKKKQEEKAEDYKKAENLVKTYLELTMQGRVDEAEKLVKKQEGQKFIKTNENLKLIGYKITNVNRVGDDISILATFTLGEKGKPYYSIDTIEYTVGMKEEDLKINKIESKDSIICFKGMVKGEEVFLINAGKATNEDPILKVAEVPSYINIKNNSLKEEKVFVNTKNFGAMAIAKDGSQLVLSTEQNGDTLLFTAEMILTTFKDETYTAQESPAAGNIEKSVEGTATEIEGVDYFKNTLIEFIAYSPSGDITYVQTNSNGKVGFSIYSSNSKNVLSPKIMKKFNSSEYNVINAYFNNDNALILQVENIKENKVENYVLDILRDKFVKQEEK